MSEARGRDYTAVALAAVHEATREEFLDVTVQLPDDYRHLLSLDPRIGAAGRVFRGYVIMRRPWADGGHAELTA